MHPKGGLHVYLAVLNEVLDRNAEWTITSRNIPNHGTTTILWGSVKDFIYGGPHGISHAYLVTTKRAHHKDRSVSHYEPGAYQGFEGSERSGRLRYSVYEFTWYHLTNTGKLIPVEYKDADTDKH